MLMSCGANMLLFPFDCCEFAVAVVVEVLITIGIDFTFEEFETDIIILNHKFDVSRIYLFLFIFLVNYL